MKRKIFSVLIALVLLASFSLVTAVPAAAATAADYNAAVIKAADRLVVLQGTDGGWDWIVTDRIVHSGTIPSPANLFGVTALGLIDAYQETGDEAYFTAAQLTADHLKTLVRADDPNVRIQSFDYRFLVEFSALSEDPSYEAHALSEWDYCKTTGSPAHYADGNQETIYNFWFTHTDPDSHGYAAWSAADFGLATLAMGDTSWASNMATVLDGHLNGITGSDIYRFIGWGHALEFLNAVDPVAYATQITSLITNLTGSQNPDGSWGTGENPEGYAQDAAYAIMGLAAVGGVDAFAAARDGADWLVTNQGYAGIEGGWNNSTTEYSETDSEALQALASAPALDLEKDWYRTGETVQVTVVDVAAMDWVKVNAVSDYDLAGIDVTLLETGEETGVFEGSFVLAPPPDRPDSPPEALMVEDDNLITVTYLGVTDTATVDDTLPVIAIDSVTSPTNQPTQAISGTFTELNPDTITLTVRGGVVDETVDKANGTWKATNPVTLDFGDNLIVVTITDLVGNEAIANATINLDTSDPAVSIDIPDFINAADESTVPVTITSNEDGTYSYTISDGNSAHDVVGSSNIAAGTDVKLTLNLNGLDDGPVTADASVTDAAGNVGDAPQDTATKDTVAPDAPSALAAPDYINDANQTTYTVTGTAEVDSTVEVRITDGTTVTNTGTATGGTFSIAVDCSTLADGTDNIIIDAKATDAAGNESSYCTPITRSKDATSPTLVIVSIFPGPTNVPPIGIRVTFSEDVTGFELADITVGNGTADRFSGSGKDYLFAITPTADGEVTVDIAAGVAEDLAGNPNLAARQFSITYDSTLPEVTVISPNGGEDWLGGSTHDITWTATDVNFGDTPITIKYSLNGGSSWDTIVADVANTGAYSWVVPNLSSSHCLINVIAVDLAHNVGHDASNFAFVMSSDTIAPAVTVNSPNGGEIWQGGSTQTITWTATDDKTPPGSLLVNLAYSPNGGTDWVDIVDFIEGSSGAYSWTVPTISSRQCLVGVGVVDTSGNVGFDISNTVFTIGTPGAPVTTIALSEGWNLVSLMLIPTSSNITDVLAGIDVVSVWAYDASIEDPAERWSSYAPTAPPDLETMVDGRGYWVEMSELAVLTIGGKELPDPPAALPAYSVVEGWNLIGFKSTTPRIAGSYLLAIDGKYTLVRGYDGSYHTIGAGGNLDPGSGYWISLTESGTIYP